MTSQEKLILLYDGNCPICCRKVAFLKRHDHHQKLDFVDINEPNKIPDSVQQSPEELASQIYAVMPAGNIIGGMDVIRAAYTQLGWGWIIAPTGWPLLKPLFDFLYRLFAKNRIRISRFLKLK